MPFYRTYVRDAMNICSFFDLILSLFQKIFTTFVAQNIAVCTMTKNGK